MPLIETTAGPLWYADHRDPVEHLPVTLLVHGAGGSHLDWPAELRRMPEANAVAADLPGHGRSPGAGRTSIGAYAAAMLALLDALKLERAIVAGHSMGGAIAQQMALDYPDRVAGIILVGTGAKLGVSPELLGAIRADKPRAVEIILRGYWGDSAEYDQLRRLSRGRLLEFNAETLYGDYAACNAFDIRARVGFIRQPALIIGGDQDTMTPLKYSQYLHEQIAGSELVVIVGGAHMMTLQQPQAVADAVRLWLSARHA